MLDDPVAFDRAEVLGRGEIDRRPRGAVGRARDHPAVELGDPDDARVLESPLLAVEAGRGGEYWLGVDRPVVDTVGRAGDSEVRDSPEVLNAREQDGFAVDRCGRRVEDGVGRIGPILRSQDRIARVTAEELSLAHAAARTGSRTEVLTPAASSRTAARWNASVDSAPSFAFSSSVPSPSLQPPVAKS